MDGQPLCQIIPRVLQVLRKNGHVVECRGVPPLLGKARGPPALSYDADLRAAEHRRTPQRKRHYVLPMTCRVSPPQAAGEARRGDLTNADCIILKKARVT